MKKSMQRSIVYTCAFGKERNSNPITQTHVIEVLKKYLKNISYVKVYSEKGNVIKKIIKILGDIFCLVTPFCSHRIFFYPTIPLYPARKSKERMAVCTYKTMNFIDNTFKIKRTVIIMDMPIEQAEDLKIHSVSKDLRRAVKRVESLLLKDADYIVDIGNFTKICPPLSGKIIKTHFCPCQFKFTELPIKENFDKVKVFYAGDMRREYEKNFIMDIIDGINFENSNAVLNLCGYADEEFKRVCQLTKNINYYGFIPNEQCDILAKGCDFALMIYPAEGYYNYVSAAKFVTYVGNGLPILAINSYTIAENIDKFKIGEAVDKDNFINSLKKWIKEKEYIKYQNNIFKLRQNLTKGDFFDCLSEISKKD